MDSFANKYFQMEIIADDKHQELKRYSLWKDAI